MLKKNRRNLENPVRSEGSMCRQKKFSVQSDLGKKGEDERTISSRHVPVQSEEQMSGKGKKEPKRRETSKNKPFQVGYDSPSLWKGPSL